jgi:Tol biopolymer transport system component
VLVDGDSAQLEPQLSPDGRWLAYQSDESGRAEVLARPYPRRQQRPLADLERRRTVAALEPRRP